MIKVEVLGRVGSMESAVSAAVVVAAAAVVVDAGLEIVLDRKNWILTMLSSMPCRKDFESRVDGGGGSLLLLLLLL